MLKRILTRDFKTLTYLPKTVGTSLYSSDNSIKKLDEDDIKPIIYDKPPPVKEQARTKRVTRKKPFKHYFDEEERDKGKIVFYEEFFDQNTKLKDRDNFMVSQRIIPIDFSHFKNRSDFKIRVQSKLLD